MSDDSTFGRQPNPVKVTITGVSELDNNVAFAQLMRYAAYTMGDVQQLYGYEFIIYPKAVND